MDLAGFRASLDRDAPPAGLGRALAALWHAAKGDWQRAHRLAQADDSAAGAWIHAYLHRVEGDDANARYWYRRAGKPVCTATLREEWAALVRTLSET